MEYQPSDPRAKRQHRPQANERRVQHSCARGLLSLPFLHTETWEQSDEE